MRFPKASFLPLMDTQATLTTEDSRGLSVFPNSILYFWEPPAKQVCSLLLAKEIVPPHC